MEQPGRLWEVQPQVQQALQHPLQEVEMRARQSLSLDLTYRLREQLEVWVELPALVVQASPA